MNYETIKDLPASSFRRSVGIERKLFHELVGVLALAEAAKKKSGRPSLSLENQLCLALSYWREYRTLFHLGLSYGVHESNAQRIVTRVENRLAASGFLAQVKPAVGSAVEVGNRSDACAVVILDASKVPIERPKKSKRPTTVATSTPTL
jgi:hypothetical protein